MSKKVMVIDDDENTVKYVTTVLEEAGYETVSAVDGREGLEKLQETAVDLIVLDVMMPKKTGFVLFKQLKRDEKLKDIPVLMLTAVASVLQEEDAGAGDTAERPYDTLREAMRKAIQQMREEGDVRPEMFVDKPVDPETFTAKVHELIGE